MPTRDAAPGVAVFWALVVVPEVFVPERVVVAVDGVPICVVALEAEEEVIVESVVEVPEEELALVEVEVEVLFELEPSSVEMVMPAVPQTSVHAFIASDRALLQLDCK